ncbi:MAG: DUF4864 domain-containing protein [Pseudomonadota bacterium]
MNRISRTLTGLAFVFAPLTAPAQSLEEAQAIEGVIRDQIAAIQQDDWATAFAYASPMIQGIFQNPETFSRMVTKGYPMVWRPKSFRSGEIADGPDGYVQTMLFEDLQGRLFVADYFMKLIDGAWRINGVQIRPAEEQSV